MGRERSANLLRRLVLGEDATVKRPPGPTPWPLAGCLPQVMKDLIGFMDEMRAHGPISYAPMPFGSFYLITEPEDIEYVFVKRAKDMHKDAYTQDLARILGEGLLTSEGKLWRRQRKLVAHAFTPRRVKSYGDAMTAAVGRATEAWSARGEIDLHDAMGSLALDIVARALFDADVREDADEVTEAMGIISDFYGGSAEAFLRVPESVPTPANRAVGAARDRLDRILHQMIEERRRSGEDRGDLLSAMVLASDEEGKMSPKLLRDEAMTLFLAGHETTALSITHTFYLLGRHPQIVKKLHAELDEVLQGRPPTEGDVERLQYTTAIVKEALRLYPSAYAVGRENVVDIELQGYRIPAGSQITASIMGQHRDPRWFPNPEGFDPERWQPGFGRSLPRFTYMPFGAGPRICIGQHFAMLESILVVAGLAQRFRFELVNSRELRFTPSVTLRPKEHVHVRVVPR